MSSYPNYSSNNSDRLIQLSSNINELYRWGSTHESYIVGMVCFDYKQDTKNSHTLESNATNLMELDAYQQQELEEIANLNKNIDIFGTDLDQVMIIISFYHRSMILQYFMWMMFQINYNLLKE